MSKPDPDDVWEVEPGAEEIVLRTLDSGPALPALLLGGTVGGRRLDVVAEQPPAPEVEPEAEPEPEPEAIVADIPAYAQIAAFTLGVKRSEPMANWKQLWITAKREFPEETQSDWETFKRTVLRWWKRWGKTGRA